MPAGTRASTAPGELVTLPCDWPAGSTFSYEYTRRRTDSRQPMLAGMSSVTPLTVEVTQGGDPSRVVWTLGETRMEGPEELVGLVSPFLGELTQIPMELELTGGSVSGLLNHEEVIDGMEPLLRSMTGDAPAEVVEQTLDVFRDPEIGGTLLSKEPARFFSMHCVQFREGEVLSAVIDYPNPFGGPPIPTTSTVELVAYDRGAGTVTFETVDATDPEALRAMMPSLLERFAPGSALEDVDMDQILAEMPPIESLMTGTLTYSVADGFPVELHIHQDIGARDHPLHRSDTWIWVRVEDE